MSHTDLLAKTLKVLQDANEPMTAVILAGRVGVGFGLGNETKRREIRNIIHQLRDQGHKIVSTNLEGYWLTDDDDTWKKYLENDVIEGKSLIGAAKKKQRQLAAKGQGMLFNPTAADAFRS